MSSTLHAKGDMTEPGKLRFTPACNPPDARFERTLRFKGAFLHVEAIEGTVDRTITSVAELPLEGGALIFSLKGTVLYRTDRDLSWRVVAPQSATVVESPSTATIRIAKGPHSALSVYWGSGALPVLESWLDARREANSRQPRAIATQPIYPQHKDAYERFLQAVESKEAHAEHMVAAVVLQMASSLILAEQAHSLAPAPQGIPDLTKKLIDTVRGNPSDPWPLKEAADFVGYSPFHFSRIFKAQVGMGFHEFVDRTRTEYAVHLLTSTDHAIDVVATEAGFGTTQGLRESVKEYLGLVPSELRSTPEDA